MKRTRSTISKRKEAEQFLAGIDRVLHRAAREATGTSGLTAPMPAFAKKLAEARDKFEISKGTELIALARRAGIVSEADVGALRKKLNASRSASGLRPVTRGRAASPQVRVRGL